jgi:hypothetical protein
LRKNILLGENQVSQFHGSVGKFAGSFALTTILCIGYIFLMSNHTKTLAYISIVCLEIIHLAMIGYGFYLISLGGAAIGVGIFLVVCFGVIALIQNCLLCFYWSRL